MNEREINYSDLPITDKQRQISAFLQDNLFDTIGSLPNFKIVQTANPDPDNDPDCFTWALQNETGSVYTRRKKFYEEHQQVYDPNQGDYVVYFKDNKMTHIGILVNNQTAISKFGKAHVYRHPITEVPHYYLDEDQDIRFYRKNK